MFYKFLIGLLTVVVAIPGTSDRITATTTNNSLVQEQNTLSLSDRIKVKDLDQILQERDFAENTPIELLILSACQTATGDKAEALRQAQLKLMQNPQYQHPYYWSAFVLVGSWK